MRLNLLSPFSTTRRKELLRMANEEWPFILSDKDPLVFILEFMDYLVGCKVAYVAVLMIVVNLLIDAGLIFLVVSIIIKRFF